MAFSGLGAGTQADPFQITTLAELQSLSNYYYFTAYNFLGTGPEFSPGYGNSYSGKEGNTYKWVCHSNNSITSVTIINGGSGYSVGTKFYVGTHEKKARFKVTSVNNGVVIGVSKDDYNGGDYLPDTSYVTEVYQGSGTGLIVKTLSVGNGIDHNYFNVLKNGVDIGFPTSGIVDGVRIPFVNSYYNPTDSVEVTYSYIFYAELKNDIDCENSNKFSINNFGGNIDGKNFSILNINHPTSSSNYCFVVAGNASLKNITLRFAFANNELIIFSFKSSLNQVITIENVSIFLNTTTIAIKSLISGAQFIDKIIADEIRIEGNVLSELFSISVNLETHVHNLYFNRPNAEASKSAIFSGGSISDKVIDIQNIYLSCPNFSVSSTADLKILFSGNPGKSSTICTFKNIVIEGHFDISALPTGNYCTVLGVSGNYLGLKISDVLFKGTFKFLNGETNNIKSGFLGLSMFGATSPIYSNMVLNANLITPQNQDRLLFSNESNFFTGCYYNSSKDLPTTSDIQGIQTGLTSLQFLDQLNFPTLDFVNNWTMTENGPELQFTQNIEWEIKPFYTKIESTARSLEPNKLDIVISSSELTGFGVEIHENGVLFSDIADTLNISYLITKDCSLLIKAYYLDLNGEKVYSSNKSEIIFYLPSFFENAEIINVSDYTLLNNPIPAFFIHGSAIHGDYIFGSMRNLTSNQTSHGAIVRISRSNIQNYTMVPVIPDPDLEAVYNNTDFASDMEQLIICKGKIFTVASSTKFNLGSRLLVMLDPITLEIKYFKSPKYQSSAPLTCDENYIYLTSIGDVYKINVDQLLAPELPQYNYDLVITIESQFYNSLSQGQYLDNPLITDDLKGISHAVAIDNEFIYISYASMANSGYDPVTDINKCELHKIRKSDMTAAGYVVVPKATDDMIQDDMYLYLGKEITHMNQDTGALGYDWGTFAVRKSDLTIFPIRWLGVEDTASTTSYASLIFGNYLFDAKTNRTLYVIDKSNVALWNTSIPAGSFTLKKYKFHWQGSLVPGTPNEIMLDEDGHFYAFLWGNSETPSGIMKFELPDLSIYVPPTVITSVVQKSASDFLFSGFIVLTGGKTTLTRGVRLGANPEELTQIILSEDLTDEFSVNIPNLPKGLYYYQAFATNMKGESIASVRSFEWRNYHWRVKLVSSSVTKASEDNTVEVFKLIS